MNTEHDAFEFLESSGGIAHYRHRGNRLQVLLLADHTTPVAAFMVTYHVGSRNEAPGTTGATHLLEHLMFKGSERFNKRAGTDVFEILQEVGAQVNASTWLDRTNYYELLPAEHLPLAIEIEADRMRNALITDEDLASERVVVLNELDRGQNSPLRNLHHSVWSTAFHAHPYGHPTIGWRSDVETVTAAGLKSYYDTFYWPGNATVSVIGNIDPHAVLTLVDKHFGGIPENGGDLPVVTTVEPEQVGERQVTVKQSGQLGAVIRAYKTPGALDPDTDALHVLDRAHFGNRGAAAKGAEILARNLSIPTDQLCEMVLEETENRIRDLVIKYIITRSWGRSLCGFLSSHADNPYLQTDFSLKVPLIGIGAAATFFLPGVASKLSTSVSFPPFSEVGNAVGAGWTGLKRMESAKDQLS